MIGFINWFLIKIMGTIIKYLIQLSCITVAISFVLFLSLLVLLYYRLSL